MWHNKQVSQLPLALLVAVIGLLLTQLRGAGVLSSRSVFFALSLLTLVYLGLEIRRLRLVHPDRWLLNPVVLCSFVTFVLGYGMTNVLFLIPNEQLALVGFVPEVTPAMAMVMWLVLLGAVAMWWGYWSPFAARLCSPAAAHSFKRRFLPRSDTPRPFALIGLFAVALTARLVQIQLGVYGYSSTYDRLIELGSVTQYLAMGSGLGKLALVLSALQFFRCPSSRAARNWFYGLLAVEVLFGFMSGFKSAVVIPFIIVAICQYTQTSRFSKYWIILGLVGVVAAYAVIEPFRQEKNNSTTFQGTSLVSIVSTMISASGTSVGDKAEQAGTLLSVSSRLNQSYIGSFGIEFSDRNLSLPAGSPNFLGDLFLAPLHAWIPRLIWDAKSLGNLGLWYTQVVMGMDHLSSTAMGPFTYLYFAGGFIAVFLGFFFIGIVQRSLFFLLNPGVSMAGSVIFLAMLNTIVSIDSSFNGILISLFREIPLLIGLQFFLFRSRRTNSTFRHNSYGTNQPGSANLKVAV